MSACLLDKDLTLLCTTVTVGLDFEWAEWEGGASVTAAAYVTPCSSAAAVAADFKLQNILPKCASNYCGRSCYRSWNQIKESCVFSLKTISNVARS